LNAEKIDGTQIATYIDLAVSEKAPEIYKPREGKVNSNVAKFTDEHLKYMGEQAPDLLTKLGYMSLFTGKKYKETLPAWNKKVLAKSIKNLHESEDVTSIMVNYPALLLRKKSQLYPEGRTSYRFKRELRKQVTILGKSAFNEAVAKTDMTKVFRFNEMD